MKKKIFASMLAFIMVIALIPVMAFASPDELTKFEATINVPHVGEMLDYAPQADIDPSDSAAIESVTWYKILSTDYNIGEDNDWIKVAENETAAKGYLYRPVIRVSLGDDCDVAQEISVKLNDVSLETGKPDAGYTVDDNGLNVSGVYTPISDTKYLTKFDAAINIPHVGETLDYAPQADIDPSGSAAIESVTWYKILSTDYNIGEDNDWIKVAENETAAKGYLYRPVIRVSLGDDCDVAQEISVKLNDVSLETGKPDAGYTVDDNGLNVSGVYTPISDTKYLTKFDAAINIPHVGETLDYAPQADIDPSGSAAIESVTWYKILSTDYNIGEDNDWIKVAENETAAKGYLYRPVIRVSLGDDCDVAQEISVKLNDVSLETGKPDAGYTVDDNGLNVSGVYTPISDTKYLTKFEATIDSPQVGKTLDYEAVTSIDPKDGAAIENITWYKILKASYNDAPGAINDWIRMTDKNEAVQAGYLYMAVIKAPLGEDYAAADNITVKLNNKALPESLTGGTDMYYIDDNALFMFYTFEPSAQKTTPEPTKTDAKAAGAKTGDNSNMTIWIILIAASAAAGVSVVVKRKISNKK